jgi:hypothetical protein
LDLQSLLEEHMKYSHPEIDEIAIDIPTSKTSRNGR